jgi:hypothetical protein
MTNVHCNQRATVDLRHVQQFCSQFPCPRNFHILSCCPYRFLRPNVPSRAGTWPTYTLHVSPPRDGGPGAGIRGP